MEKIFNNLGIAEIRLKSGLPKRTDFSFNLMFSFISELLKIIYQKQDKETFFPYLCLHLVARWRITHSASGCDIESTHLVTDRLRFLGYAELGRARDRNVEMNKYKYFAKNLYRSYGNNNIRRFDKKGVFTSGYSKFP